MSKKDQNSPSLEQRIFAFAIDTFLFSALNIFVIVAFASFGDHLFSYFGVSKAPQLFKANLQAFYLFSTPMVFLSYFTFSLYMMNGKTLGKMVNKTQVVSDKEHLDFKTCLLRSCGYLFCFLSFGLFFVPNFFRQDQLGLPDMLSNSYSQLETAEKAVEQGELIFLHREVSVFSGEDDETKAA